MMKWYNAWKMTSLFARWVRAEVNTNLRRITTPKSMTTSNEIKRGKGRRAPHKSKEPPKKKPKEDLNITKYFNCNQMFPL